MKQVNKLFLLFVVVIIAIFTYAYMAGKDLKSKTYTGLSDIKEMMVLNDNAGSEGDDPLTSVENRVYDKDANTMKQLYEKSDVIAKVTLKGRSQAINTMCSQVEVLDIYKGKQNIDGSSIQVYEPFGILYNGDKQEMLKIFGACLPMRENEEYILFLRKEMDGKYNFVSGLYGKYHVGNDAYLKTDGSETSVQEILEYDMLDFYMSEERKAQIDEELALGGLDKEAALTEMKSYKQLKNLKETRASIRSQFSKYGIVS